VRSHGHPQHGYGLDWEKLTHQVISHFHIDHVGELPALLFAFKYGRWGSRSEPLELVGPPGIEFLLHSYVGLYKMKLNEQEFPLLVREVEPGRDLRLTSSLLLRTTKTPHTAESMAVRLEGSKSIGYTGDTAPSDDLVELFRDADAVIAECSFMDDNRGTRHLIADDVAEMARRAGVKTLVATHSYFDPEQENLRERLQAGFEGRVIVAADGMTIEFD
jgi:ribonuclease BN (tRNA processing enzyme)